MNLSAHFTLEEMERSATAQARRIDNRAPPAVLENLRMLAEILEQARAVLGAPIIVTSGYRSPALNAVMPGASPRSAHMQGLAADLVAPEFGTPAQVAEAIDLSTVPFDRLILEHAARGSWVHFQIAPKGQSPRRQAWWLSAA